MYCCSFEMTLRIILDIEVQYQVLTAPNVVRLAFDFTLGKRRKNFWWNPLFPLDALYKISHHKRASYDARTVLGAGGSTAGGVRVGPD